MDFFVKHWQDILLTLVSAGALAFCRYFYKRMKAYRDTLKEKEQEETEALIDKKIEPIVQEIEELRTYMMQSDLSEQKRIDLIIASYKYRLIQLCKIYLRQGFMTQDQYDQIVEFYKTYSGLGGNGQAKEYYERTMKLPIKKEED